ncbi:sigma-70 family RNA polymerase sigma factor [Salinispirillum marinum]|uniref:Sigma-70 family RNA polymerase sigma factor n=2 Tax=Saccharospirillaceae TaxID=255527 RepID=A0ABV8BF95_9GAMM
MTKNDRTAWYSQLANDYPALSAKQQQAYLWALMRALVRLQCWRGDAIPAYLNRCKTRLQQVESEVENIWQSEHDAIAYWLEHLRAESRRHPTLRRRWAVVEQIRKRILLHNQRLIIRQVHRRPTYSLEIGDLIMEGNVGLMRALDLFDPRKAYRFSTYAHFWIEQSLLLALKQKTHTVRTPLSAINKAYQANKERDLLGTETMSNQKAFTDTLSLDDPDVILDLDHSDSRRAQEHSDNQRLVKEILRRLPDRLRQVLLLRYGVDQRDNVGYREIADQMGVSRERARQLEQEALAQLRNDLLSQNTEWQ